MTRVVAIFAILAIALSSCSKNEAYDSMPQEIQEFLAQYYPNSQLYSFESNDDGYVAVIKNGPTITFGLNYRWTTVDGNGAALPQNLLFNTLPTPLYNYLKESETTNSVFKMQRTASEYTITLLNYTLHYDIATEKITGSDTPPD